MFKPVRLMLFLLPVLILATAQAEKVHKWIDASGVTHYSDRPPLVDADTDVIAPIDEPVMDADTTEVAEPGANEETVQQPQASLTPNPEVIAYCQQLKANMQALEGEQRVRLKRDDGSFEILENEGREREMRRIQEQMKKYCQ